MCGALESVGDALVPGALLAGLAPFIDSQLALGSGSKLIAKYLGVDPLDQQGFYIALADNLITKLALPENTPEQLIGAMATDAPDRLDGATRQLCFFCIAR